MPDRLDYFDQDDFTKAYISCALWVEHDESTPSGGEPFDANYDETHFSQESLAVMIEDCRDFQAKAGDKIQGEEGAAGHDFWLTRNGHGAGFWDGDWPTHGEALDKLSKTYGECDLELGDDGQIHVC